MAERKWCRTDKQILSKPFGIMVFYGSRGEFSPPCWITIDADKTPSFVCIYREWLTIKGFSFEIHFCLHIRQREKYIIFYMLTQQMEDFVLSGDFVLFGEQLYRLPDESPDLSGLRSPWRRCGHRRKVWDSSFISFPQSGQPWEK